MTFKIGLDEKVTRGEMTPACRKKQKLLTYSLIGERKSSSFIKRKNRSKRTVFVKPKLNIFFNLQFFVIPSFLTGFLCSWALWTRGSALYPFIFTEDGLEHRSSIEIVTKGNVYSVFVF